MLNAKVIHELMKIKGIRSIHELALETKLPYTTLNYMFKGHDMHVSSLIELAHYSKKMKRSNARRLIFTKLHCQ